MCAICGNRILAFEDCEVDHIVPFSRGGATTIENAQLAHRTCNRSKSNRLDEKLALIDNDTTEDDVES